MKRLLLFVVLAVLALPAERARLDLRRRVRLAVLRLAPTTLRRRRERLQRRRTARRRGRQRHIGSDPRTASRSTCARPTAASSQEAGSPVRLSDGPNYVVVRRLRRRRPPGPRGRRTSSAGRHRPGAQPGRAASPRPRHRHPSPPEAARSRPPTSTATGVWISSSAAGTTPSSACCTRQGNGLRLRTRVRQSAPTRARSRSATSTATAARTSPSRTAGCDTRHDPAAQRDGTASSRSARFPSATRPAGIAAGDFNGDGRVDVAVVELRPTTRSNCCCATPRNNGFDGDGAAVAVPTGPIGPRGRRLRPQRHARRSRSPARRAAP